MFFFFFFIDVEDTATNLKLKNPEVPPLLPAGHGQNAFVVFCTHTYKLDDKSAQAKGLQVQTSVFKLLQRSTIGKKNKKF